MIIVLANYLAFSLRFDGAIPPDYRTVFAVGLPVVLCVRLATFGAFRLFGGLWRYVGVWDVRNIVAAGLLSSLVVAVVFEGAGFGRYYPRSVIAIDTGLVIIMVAGIRVLGSVYRGLGSRGPSTRVLIVGAGDAGALVVREMMNNPAVGAIPVALVDDDPIKKGGYIHGVRVYGGRSHLADTVRRTRPDEILVAMPSVTPQVLREVVASLEPFRLPIKTLPSMATMLSGRHAINAIRPLAVEDLLQRPSRHRPAVAVEPVLRGKRVLVTGAGGSIGSELSRQVAACGPATLVLVDRYENGLHDVGLEVCARDRVPHCETVIADITDAGRMSAVFSSLRPDVVFHAAAHKHVPLMEASPCEAVKNNVRGTRVVAELADRHAVERFVLISTDKAVNPTSVMGATKRVAEMVVRDLARTSATTFTSVRFGNVLASNGSVVPLFQRQIAAGGPVTVTHPEMRRYFMSIPEAVQLVLQAAVMARSGDLFVLEMGEQVKVVELARNLIRLSGLRPDEDIDVTFIGVRPGEKLYEELIAADEVAEKSAHPMILRVRPAGDTESRPLAEIVDPLEAAALADDRSRVARLLVSLFPSMDAERARVEALRSSG